MDYFPNSDGGILSSSSAAENVKISYNLAIGRKNNFTPKGVKGELKSKPPRSTTVATHLRVNTVFSLLKPFLV